MAIYAAMVDRLDQNVGRLVATLEELGELDDTLILFLADNGGCAEGGVRGGGPDEQVGTREGYFLTYGKGWANASNTPFRLYKHWVHEGGIASPLIAHWPKGIAARGELRREPCHLVDLAPTLVELAGARYPRSRAGHAVPPMEGVSLVSAFHGAPLQRDRPLFFEHEGNRAVRDGRWKLVARHGAPWALYDLELDREETIDLAAAHPARVEALRAAWEAWAERVGVRPWPVARREGFLPPDDPYPLTWKDLELLGR